MEDWKIFLGEILGDFGVELSSDQLAAFAEACVTHQSCMSDMAYEMCGGRSSTPAVDYEKLYKAAQHKLEVLEQENAVYLQSVCSRRNVEPHQVRIEGDSVIVYP